MNTINAKQVLSLIGALAGEPVQLHQARLMDGQQAFAIVPTAPGRLHLPLWRNVRQAPSGGVWLSPEAAIVGFTHLIAQIAKQERRPTQESIRRRVMTLLDGGPLSAQQVKSILEGEGATWRQVDRAARSLGVLRRKAGMRSGWTWHLQPPGAVPGAAVADA